MASSTLRDQPGTSKESFEDFYTEVSLTRATMPCQRQSTLATAQAPEKKRKHLPIILQNK